MSKGAPHGLGFSWVAIVEHVLALSLIADRLPLFRLMAKEVTLKPMPGVPWAVRPCVSTYNTPVGREEELPQLSSNELRAHTPTNTTTLLVLFNIDIYAPYSFRRFRAVRRFPSAGDTAPAVPETCSLWLKYICLSGMGGKSKPLDRWTSRNPDFHLQPTLFAVGCAQLPAVQPDGAIRNRQAQTRAPGLAVAGIVQAIKRLEDLGQRLIGNAGAAIEHANNDFFSIAVRCRFALQSHLHRCTFGSIARGVPHHILHRAAEQVGIAVDQKFVRSISIFIRIAGVGDRSHAAAPARSFVAGVVRHLLHQLAQR